MEGLNPDLIIYEMTPNLLIRVNQDGTVDAKISGNFPTFGSCRIDGILITVNSQIFVKIWG